MYKEVQVKNGRKWETTYIERDPLEVYRSLSRDMVYKKLCSAPYIRSITRQPLYNGYDHITVTYDNGTRAIYEVEA